MTLKREPNAIAELKRRFLRRERWKAFGYFTLALALLAYLIGR